MEILDAYWEKRNLNLVTTEVVVRDDDSFEEIKNLLHALESEYVVVKIPTGNIEISFLLKELGYVFVETMTHSEFLLENTTPDSKYMGLNSHFLIADAQKKDIEKIYHIIRTGLYSTDRISVDPYFTKEIANRRYVGWLDDELSRGMKLYMFKYQNEDVGFIGIKEEMDRVHRIVLYGIYPEYQRRGLATQFIYKTVIDLKMNGSARLLIDISSNNLPSLKCCQNVGFKIVDFTYVFVKHNLSKDKYQINGKCTLHIKE